MLKEATVAIVWSNCWLGVNIFNTQEHKADIYCYFCVEKNDIIGQM